LVCTPGSKLGQMAHQRKGGTRPKVGVPPMPLEWSLSDLVIMRESASIPGDMGVSQD
jgi:hypothetical protein